MGPLLPSEGDRPAFAQIYIHDPSDQVRHRQSIYSNLDPVLLSELPALLSTVNTLAGRLQTAAERMAENPDATLQLRISGEAGRGRRQYDAPAVAEVAVINPGAEDDADQPTIRDVVYMTKRGDIRRINETYSIYDPLRFVLILPMAECGWTTDIERLSQMM